VPRPKGLPKTGGRKKGTPNKATYPVAELCEKLGCNPIEALIAFCKSQHPDFRFAAAKELAQYLHPKRKAVELSGPNGGDLFQSLTDEELSRKIEAHLGRLK